MAKKKKFYNSGGMFPNVRGLAGLPQQPVMKDYPAETYNMPEGLNDTLTGIDNQIKGDLRLKKPINSSKF